MLEGKGASAAKSLQSCPTLCDPIDGSPPGSPVPAVLQARILGRGLPFPSPLHACMLSYFSHVRLFAVPWTAAHQDSLSTGFSRQEYWSGLPFPTPVGRVWQKRKRKKKNGLREGGRRNEQQEQWISAYWAGLTRLSSWLTWNCKSHIIHRQKSFQGVTEGPGKNDF